MTSCQLAVVNVRQGAETSVSILVSPIASSLDTLLMFEGLPGAAARDARLGLTTFDTRLHCRRSVLSWPTTVQHFSDRYRGSWSRLQAVCGARLLNISEVVGCLHPTNAKSSDLRLSTAEPLNGGAIQIRAGTIRTYYFEYACI